jgi:hypothetical protein
LLRILSTLPLSPLTYLYLPTSAEEDDLDQLCPHLSDDEQVQTSEGYEGAVDIERSSRMIEPEMVYFTIHRPLRFFAREYPSLTQYIEHDSICYAIHDPSIRDQDITSINDSTVTRFSGAELPDMINTYPNALFYVLQNPTWAELDQLDDLFDEYPDSVVYVVPRPVYFRHPSDDEGDDDDSESTSIEQNTNQESWS